MPPDWNQPVGQTFKHDPGVDNDVSIRRCSVDPFFVDLDLEASGSRARECGNEVYVSVLFSPDVPVTPSIWCFQHWRIPDGSSEM